jgi:hypothetical protein
MHTQNLNRSSCTASMVRCSNHGRDCIPPLCFAAALAGIVLSADCQTARDCSRTVTFLLNLRPTINNRAAHKAHPTHKLRPCLGSTQHMLNGVHGARGCHVLLPLMAESSARVPCQAVIATAHCSPDW